jgi:zinc protease
VERPRSTGGTRSMIDARSRRRFERSAPRFAVPSAQHSDEAILRRDDRPAARLAARSAAAWARAWALPALFLTSLLCGCSHGQAGQRGRESDPLPPVAGPSPEGIYEATLPNGMKVLMKESHAAPILCFSIWYRAGSKHEEVGRTGLAHLLEHMMFKGTERYGKGIYDRTLESNGALNNATTWLDRTNFYVVIAADRVDVAMELEADRMRGALFTDQDLEDEMPVVRNEMELGEDDPFTELDERIGSVAFLEHPYHWPTIGWKSDVEAIRASDIHDYYDRYYWPNNAYLVLVGDLPVSEMLDKAVEHFGSLPRGGVEPRVVTVEPPQKGERRFLIRESGETRLLGFGYRIPEAMHGDLPALTALGRILAEGRSSRLYRALVERGLASEVQAYAQPMEDPFLFFIYVTLSEEADPDQVERLVNEEIERLQSEPPADAELARAFRQFKVSTLFERDDLSSLMFEIGEAESHGGYELFDHALARMEAVTGEDVRRAAATHLVPDQRTVGFYLPRDSVGGSWTSSARAAADGKGAGNQSSRGAGSERERDRAGASAAGASAAGTAANDRARAGAVNQNAGDAADMTAAHAANPAGRSAAQDAAREAESVRDARSEERSAATVSTTTPTRAVLGNGAVVIVQESRDNPTVVLNARLRGGLRLEPRGKQGVAALVCESWLLGTRERTAAELADLLESRGIIIEITPGRDAITLQSRCLAEDFPLLVDLVGEALREPRFDPEQIEIAREAVLHDLREELESTSSIAHHRALEILYGAGSPYSRLTSGDAESVRSLGREDLVAYHESLSRAGGWAFAVVGDVSAGEARALLENAIGDVAAGEPALTPAPAPRDVPSWQVTSISVPDKSQVDLVFLGRGIAPGTEGYAAAYLADAVLGEAYTSRLNGTLRDDEGLTYGAYSFFDHLEGGSLWGAALGVNPENVARALAGVQRVLLSFREEGLTEEELARVREYAAGSYALRNRTKARIASELLQAERFGLPPEWVSGFGERLRTTSNEKIQEAAKSLVDPDRLAVVAAGTLEER